MTSFRRIIFTDASQKQIFSQFDWIDFHHVPYLGNTQMQILMIIFQNGFIFVSHNPNTTKHNSTSYPGSYLRTPSSYGKTPISFPEHARSQVKGGHGSGEIELIQACDWLTADNTLDFQREFYINKVFGISRRKCYTFYTEID